MIKKSLTMAVGISIGLALGGCILPRLFSPNMYNSTWPAVWKQAVLYMAVGFIVSFVVSLAINWCTKKFKK